MYNLRGNRAEPPHSDGLLLIYSFEYGEGYANG